MIEPYLKNYCIIGLGKVDEVKDDLTVISESSINFVSGEGLLIATFTSTFHIGEIEDILKTNDNMKLIPKNSTSKHFIKLEFPGLIVSQCEYSEGPVGLTFIRSKKGFKV